jgi:DNA-binding response OmpR family regulator
MKTVFVVDDSSTMRALIKMNLHRVPGVSVVEAVNGRDALQKMAATPPDLVLTDINMPEMDGLALVVALRQKKSARELPIIIISTKGEERDLIKGMSLGANDYVPKPINALALVDKVRSFLGLTLAHVSSHQAATVHAMAH